jgi:DNA-binding NtrC family response regulator
MLVIVDDDGLVLESLADYFQTRFNLKTFLSPKTAIEFVEKERFFPQVCLLDFRMPEMNGGVLESRIKNIDESIQVILMSGFSDFDQVQLLLKQKSIDEFQRKPLDFHVLHRSIEFRRKLFLKKNAI